MLAIVAEVTGLVSGFGASRRFFRLQLGINAESGSRAPDALPRRGSLGRGSGPT